MTVCGYDGVEKWLDLYWVDWWFDLSECVDELSLTLFWDEETEVGLLVRRQFCERGWDAVCWLQTLHLTHSQAELCPGSWDSLFEGLGHPEYLPGALPVVTGVPDSPICFPGGVVDPVGWDYSWVPRALHLKCRSSFFCLFVCLFVFYCGKNLRLNTEGVLTKRTDGSSEPLDDFHCDLGHSDSVLLLSCLEGVQS